MNKLTKQLLSLGLSAVTVAGMVSPVLADDEVPATTEPTEEITEVSEQPTEVVEQPTESVDNSVQQEKEEVSTTNPSSSDVTDTTNENKKTIIIDISYVNDEKKPYTVTKIVDKDVYVYQYVSDNLIPDGYNIYEFSENNTQEHYEVVICKHATLTKQTFIDGVDKGVTYSNIPDTFTDQQIKDKLMQDYAYSSYNIKSVEKSKDGTWIVRLETPDANNEKYTLIINKDGKQTSQKIIMTKEDLKAYGGVEVFLRKYYLPDGYRIENKNGNGIHKLGEDTWVMDLAKNAENNGKKTFTLVMTLSNKTMGDDIGLEGGKVECHTFEYDKSGEGILDYMTKKYLPKGYMWQIGATPDMEVFRYTAYKLPAKEEKYTNYKVNCIDSETKESFSSYYSYSGINLLGEKRTSIKNSDVTWFPYGYVVDGDSFPVTEKDGQLTVDIYFKKADYNIPVNIKFLENVDGKLKTIKEVNASSKEIDIDDDKTFQRTELAPYLPKGYNFIDKFMYYDHYIYNDGVFRNYNIEYVVTKTSSTVESSESKDIASIQNKDVTTILTDSLTKDQKKKVEAALNDGKNVDFKPILKNGVNKSDEKVLLAYVDDNKYNVVNAFDIEIQLYVDDKNEGLITETNKELTFKVNIPESLKKEGRKFYVLRLHGNQSKPEKLLVNEDGTFTTDKFSSYMLVYEDKVTASETKPEVKPGTSTETKPEVKPSTGSTTNTTDTKKDNTVKKDVKKNKKVNTSTKTSSTLFTGLLGVSIVGLGAVEVLRRRNK